MSSSKTLTPPLDEGSPQLKLYRMERPTGQLFELKELQKQQLADLDEVDEFPPPPGPPPGAPPPPLPIPQGDERGLREFNYNGRDIKPRNSERSSGAMGRRRLSSYSQFSDYSSHASLYEAPDYDRGIGNGEGRGGGGGGSGGVPQVEHIERPPRRHPGMEATLGHLRTRSDNTRGGGVVSQPPPTYAPPRERELFNRVRFAEQQERARREESRGPGARRIDMVDVVGGPSVGKLWVYACCAFFWYRCLWDEDF
ncbi:hypothetical protein CkaCkLH20_00993 [Colletotrichum karsti]|uniref:Uncharacterized protein n=1 Tax=Colletotrichum karsti TaxID=1095194 RepID=A0A9P6IED5_9PEZI|nr:uncharacterized protein CkaCkLH20_00993 [Colletotrichum karsti]KAF9881847.1 hypothetical protein CkaCkLH20_00993 [Colletotrichum karsti]